MSRKTEILVILSDSKCPVVQVLVVQQVPICSLFRENTSVRLSDYCAKLLIALVTTDSGSLFSAVINRIHLFNQ